MPAVTYVGLRPMYKCAIVPAKLFRLLVFPLIPCGNPATHSVSPMIETTPSRPFITLRTLSNIVALVALQVGLDWLYAWWTGGSTYSCSAASALGTEAFLTAAGMGGLLLAIAGITLGGVRHPMTFFGLFMVAMATIGSAVEIGEILGTCR